MSLVRTRLVAGAAWLGLLSLTSAACDPPSIADVKPPSYSRVLQALYDKPPGTLTLDNLPELAMRFASSRALLEETGRLSVLDTLVQAANDQDYGVPEPGSLDPDDNARLLGLARFAYVCRGPLGDSTVDRERFGVASLVGRVSKRGLFPVVWGKLADCVEHAGSLAYTLHGDYFVMMRAGAHGGSDRILYFDGTLETSSARYEGALDVRLLDDGAVELRIPTSQGDVVVRIHDAQLQEVRDRLGVWRCQLSMRHCENEETGEIVDAPGLAP